MFSGERVRLLLPLLCCERVPPRLFFVFSVCLFFLCFFAIVRAWGNNLIIIIYLVLLFFIFFILPAPSDLIIVRRTWPYFSVPAVFRPCVSVVPSAVPAPRVHAGIQPRRREETFPI